MENRSPTEYFGRDLEAMSFARNYHQWIFEEVAPYLGEHVAEVGAGTGNFSEYLLDTNIKQLVAFEPSSNMYSHLEEKFQDNSTIKTINALFEDHRPAHHNSFDSVCYINVLEHIKDHEKALEHAYKTMSNKGHLIIFVPALPFLYSKFDKQVGHYRRYTKATLLEVVKSAGFTIKKVRYFDIAGIIPWYLAFVVLKSSVNTTNVSLYDRFVVPLMKKVEQVVPPVIGKNLLLVGQKT